MKGPTELLNDKDEKFTNFIDRFLLVEVKNSLSLSFDIFNTLGQISRELISIDCTVQSKAFTPDFLNIKNMSYSKVNFMYDFIKPKHYEIEFTATAKIPLTSQTYQLIF